MDDDRDLMIGDENKPLENVPDNKIDEEIEQPTDEITKGNCILKI